MSGRSTEAVCRANYRARRKRYGFSDDGQIERVSKARLYAIQRQRCAICSEHNGIKDLELDHVTPVVYGGHHTWANCWLLCRPCHRRKSASAAFIENVSDSAVSVGGVEP